jgi:endonuclease YncB( thermonuclease family)
MRLPTGILILLLATSAASAQSVVGRASVIDGDTLDIRGERVRIVDIDAPESGQFCFKKTEDLDVGAWPSRLNPGAKRLGGGQGARTVRPIESRTTFPRRRHR